MSQAQDLLKNLSNDARAAEVSVTPVNDVLLIDAEGRFTNIPNTEILFGVETDQDVERKYFKCPRIVGDNIDLSELQLIIKYQNARGEKDSYYVTDKTINEEYIEFSWLLSNKVLVEDGVVYFAIQAVKTEDDGTIKNRWNTTMASGKVMETLLLDNTEYLTDLEEAEARDVLLQLLLAMDNTYMECIQNITAESNRQISRIQSTGSEQVQAIETKGSEQLQAIETTGSAMKSGITSSGESQLAAIEAKGAEIIALIEGLDSSQLNGQIDEIVELVGGIE
jgi:hypothetical protein